MYSVFCLVHVDLSLCTGGFDLRPCGMQEFAIPKYLFHSITNALTPCRRISNPTERRVSNFDFSLFTRRNGEVVTLIFHFSLFTFHFIKAGRLSFRGRNRRLRANGP